MENFEGAYRQRHKDTKALYEANRQTAAMHLGGCAVECLLKAMILAQISDPDQRKFLPRGNHREDIHHYKFKNPSHDLYQAFQKHPTLASLIQEDEVVREWLNRVQKPHSNTDFINLRYIAYNPSQEEYQAWWDAYTNLCQWLERQIWEL